MDKEKLIISLIEKLVWDTSIVNVQEENETVFLWKFVILRCRNAWVHFGKLVYAKDWVYRLEDSRRLYYWKTIKGITLSEVAEYWLHKDSKVCKTLKLIEITEREWAEIIPCTDDSISSIQEKKDYIS